MGSVVSPPVLKITTKVFALLVSMVNYSPSSSVMFINLPKNYSIGGFNLVLELWDTLGGGGVDSYEKLVKTVKQYL